VGANANGTPTTTIDENRIRYGVRAPAVRPMAAAISSILKRKKGSIMGFKKVTLVALAGLGLAAASLGPLAPASAESRSQLRSAPTMASLDRHENVMGFCDAGGIGGQSAVGYANALVDCDDQYWRCIEFRPPLDCEIERDRCEWCRDWGTQCD
jgi:hypothetical protein